MKVALIGASGNVGRRLTAELSQRGHQITAFARDISKIPELIGVTRTVGDADEPNTLTPLLRGHDAVISALRFAHSDPTKLIEAVKRARVPRYLVVGGAGSLEVAPGHLLVDSPSIPDHVKPESRAGVVFLDILRREQGLDWTFLSPAGMFVAGERTGKFRLGGDQLLKDANGDSRISYEDYAVAMVDELERPTHSCHRFTLAY